MNYLLVIRNLGKLVLLVGGCMSASLVWAVLDRSDDPSGVIGGFVVSVLICTVLGLLAYVAGRSARGEMLRKEALAVVGLSWILFGLLGALPFILTGCLQSEYDSNTELIAAAVFESVSGFTTTGASMLIDIESMPRAVLFWRSLTHWLGGMGVVVLFVAILGGTGSAGKFLVTSETTGPVSDSVRPRIRETALLLWQIYLGLSALEFVLLRLFGMNTFESLCHTFGTLASGGYSTLNRSIGQYNSLSFEVIITIFMFLAGVNFNLFASLLQGRWRVVYKNRELRAYVAIILLVGFIIAMNLYRHLPEEYTLGRAFRSATFQTVAIITTTGYGTDDFNRWPVLSQWLLIILMFVGGSAGSTAGGIKIMRLMIFLRLAVQEVEKTFRPHVVRTLRINQQAVDEGVRRNVAIYIGHVMVIFFTATIFLTVLQNEFSPPEAQLDITSAFTAVIATLNNIGPGLHMIGPTENYHFFNAPAKLLLSLLMIIGRLEVMVVLCIFTPAFWQRN